MATMNVSLPDAMKDWVEAQAASGRDANASDYIRDLIRRDQDKSDKIARMKALIDEGRASGLSDMTLDEIRIHARQKAGVATKAQ